MTFIKNNVLENYKFYFNVSQRQIKSEAGGWVEFRELKGIDFQIIGGFSLPIDKTLILDEKIE